MLADPGQMLKLFPSVLKDVSVNHNDHIDMYEIDQGLKNSKLSESEIAFLAALKVGYRALSVNDSGSYHRPW
jgi:hypothetical protein